MATWFAQTGSSGNINSANKWNAAVDGSGAWLTWPCDPADILVCNGKTVSVNVSATAAELRNDTTGGATAGGYFGMNTAGVSLTATAYSGALGYVIRGGHSSGTIYFVGDIYAGNTGSQTGFLQATAGDAAITGNVFGGLASSSPGVSNTSTGTVTITGTVTGGSGSGYGASNSSTGTIAIVGNVLAGAGVGVLNNSTGVLNVSGYAQASDTAAAVNNTAQGVVKIVETRSASNGRGAVTGAFRFSTAATQSLPIIAGSQQTLSVLDVAALVPAQTDVRKGVIYGDGAYTGTLALQRKRTTMAGRF